ncbi:MAG: 2OG-Fe(II) oxygenase family protein [Candidatus Sericytochromatia bacterium]
MSIINLSLDFNKLRQEFVNREYKYITIDNFLADDVAEILYNGFKEITDNALWYQAEYGRARVFNKNLSEFDSNIYHFCFRYEMFPLKNHTLSQMLDSNITRAGLYKVRQIDKNPEMEISYLNSVRKISHFLNSDEMHNLISYITNTELTFGNLLAFASRYTSDDFLALHSDSPTNLETPRRIAFVLNMTKNWLVHWGGSLIILDESQKNIIEAINPKFNSLTLFKVPLKHAVLPVSCHCKSERLAITGWYQKS